MEQQENMFCQAFPVKFLLIGCASVVKLLTVNETLNIRLN